MDPMVTHLLCFASGIAVGALAFYASAGGRESET